MASTKEYLQFVLEQLSGLEDITYRAMMGEYILYYRGKVVGGIYDDRLLVKPVKSAITYMPNAEYELPYEGAKEMLLVDDVDNKDYLIGLFEAMYDELPMPKPKKKKQSTFRNCIIFEDSRMNKLRKCLPYILMAWPYLFIPVAVYYGLSEDDGELSMIIIWAHVFLTLVVYALNICNAFMRNSVEDERKYASKLAFYCMVIKLVHIPFYIFVFVMGNIALAVMVVPAFMLFSPLIIFLLFIIDSALMHTSSMYGISASCRAAKAGMISRGKAVVFSVFSCFFVSDVIIAIILQIRLKRAETSRD